MNTFSVKHQIEKLRARIESGFGLTGKPLPQKRMKAMQKRLQELERTNTGESRLEKANV